MRFSVLFALIITSNAWCQYSQRDYQAALRRKSELLLQNTNILNKADSALLDWQNQTAIFFANFRLGKNYQAQFKSQLSILRDCSNILSSINDSVYKQSTTEAVMRDLVATNAKTTEQLKSYNDFELEEYSWAISRPMDSSLYLENSSQHEKTEYLLRFNSLLESVSVSNSRMCDSVIASLDELKSFNDSISLAIALQESCLQRTYNPICRIEKRVRYLREAFIRKEISNDDLFSVFYNVKFDVNYRDTTLLQPCDSIAFFPSHNSFDVIPSASNQQFYQSQHSPKIYETPEIPATFSGGKEAFDTYFQQHLNKPDHYTPGEVYVEFIVSKKGNISNVRIKRGITDCDDCSKEALRLLKSMPNWIPAVDKGKKVNSTVRLSIPFP